MLKIYPITPIDGQTADYMVQQEVRGLFVDGVDFNNVKKMTNFEWLSEEDVDPLVLRLVSLTVGSY